MFKTVVEAIKSGRSPLLFSAIEALFVSVENTNRIITLQGFSEYPKLLLF